MTKEDLIAFFAERPSVSRKNICKEVGISYTLFKYILKGDRTLTEETATKLIPVLNRYGGEFVEDKECSDPLIKTEQLRKQAQAAQQDLMECCEGMREQLKPFFLDEIYVLYQFGDGFCVVVDNDIQPNLPVTGVVKNIRENTKYYHDKVYLD